MRSWVARWWPWANPQQPVAELAARLKAKEAEIDRLRGHRDKLLLELKQARDRGRDRNQLKVQVDYLQHELDRVRALLAARERADRDLGEGL